MLLALHISGDGVNLLSGTISNHVVARGLVTWLVGFDPKHGCHYPGYQRFFLACVGELRFVGRRAATGVRPKAEDT